MQQEQQLFLANDFEAVCGLLYFGNSDPLDHTDTWNSHLKIAPQKFFDLLTQDMPAESSVLVTSICSGVISITMNGKSGAYNCKRDIDLNILEVGTGKVNVISKGNRIGRINFRNTIELGVHLGCKGYKIHASDVNGAYAWARAGVPLDMRQIDGNLKLVKGHLTQKMNRIESFCDSAIVNQVHELLEFNSSYNINDIADLNYVLPRSILNFEGELSSLSIDEKQKVIDLFEFCDSKGLDVTLGRYLLNSASYDGYLDFSDKKAMLRVQDYVGGFVTIEFLPANENRPVSKPGFNMRIPA